MESSPGPPELGSPKEGFACFDTHTRAVSFWGGGGLSQGGMAAKAGCA